MKINLAEWQKKTPFPILSFPGIQLLGTTVGTMINDSDLQSECMNVIAKRYDTPASVSLMDLSVEAECFGSEIRVTDDEVPTVVGSIVNTPEDVDNLKIPDVGAGRTGIYIESMAKALKKITDRPILAGVIGPFSLAGRLMDMTEIMVNCMDEPEMTHSLLEKTSDFIVKYAKAYKDIGAHGLVIAEPAAGLLSPAFSKEFSVPYVKKIVDMLQDDDFMVVYHNCGPYTIQQIDDILTIGAKLYHFGNAIDLSEMAKHIPSDVYFAGNISPADHFRNGTVQSITDATNDLLNKIGNLDNFILSSGCDIPPMASIDNIDAFFDAASKFYKSK